MKFSILLFTSLAFMASSLSGQNTGEIKENSMVVRGIAILKQTPEILSARISIKVQADKFNLCQEKLIKAIDQAKTIFIKRGIDKTTIHTNDLNVSEKRDYISEGRYKTSYEGNSAITVEQTYTMNYAKRLLSALQNDSVTLLYNLDFSLSENQKKELRQKAIASSIADAKEKAEAIAQSANIKLLKINTITYTDDQGGYSESDLVQENVLYSRDIAFNKAGSPVPMIDFNPKEIGIKKSITVEWLIEENK